MEPEAYAHAKLILIWGSNTLTSNLHLWPFIQAARKNGALQKHTAEFEDEQTLESIPAIRFAAHSHLE